MDGAAVLTIGRWTEFFDAASRACVDPVAVFWQHESRLEGEQCPEPQHFRACRLVNHAP
jgi:hypothetical protein